MRDRPQWPAVAAFAVAVAVLAIGIWQVAWPWIVDDAYISLRYAERLVEGHGLTWTDGERVEGYSNLLWVLLTSFGLLLGLDGMTAVRVLGIACTVGTFAVLLWSRLLPATSPAPFAVVLLASLAAVQTWAIGGLEAPLLMLLVAIAMANVAAALQDAARTRRHLTYAGIALGLAAWTRPDGPLWAVVAALFVAGFGRNGHRLVTRLRWLLLIPVLAVLGQLAFRLAYYGDWVPNTGRAKMAFSAASFTAGIGYVASAAGPMRALWLPAALGVTRLADRVARPLVVLSLLGTVAWVLYIVQIGGDNFSRSRLLVPALVPLTVLAAHGLAALPAFGRAGRVIAWTAAIVCVGLANFDARRPRDDLRQKLTEWEWLGKATGEWLGRAFAQQRPLLAVDAAGAVPYFSRLPCLDMLGLNDRTIAATPVPADRLFFAGHNRANGPYVLSRQPDLVLFGLPPGTPKPPWPGGRQMEQDPSFLADYRVVLFDTGPVDLPTGPLPNLRVTAWARLGGRLGARPSTTSPRQLVVPAFWLDSYRQPYSFLSCPPAVTPEQCAQDVQAGAAWWFAASVTGVHRDGAEWPLAEVRRRGLLKLEQLPVPKGRYRALPDGLPDGVTATVTAVSKGVVDLVCDVTPSVTLPVLLDRIVLERID